MREFKAYLKSFVGSRFFIILVAIAVFLTVMPMTLAAMGRTDILRSGANLIAAPFKSAAAFCGEALGGFSEYFSELERLKAENEALREELEQEKLKNEMDEIMKEEYEWLKGFVLFNSENPELSLIDAKAVGCESGDYITSFTLNKGTKDGVSKGMPVITDKGLLGYVSEVGLSYAKVKTLSTEDTALGAICVRSGVYGMIEGSYSYLSEGLCRMVCSTESSDVVEGDLIFTSGVGSVYPFGLFIGRVERVEKDPYSRNTVVYIKTAEEFTSVSRVMVVVDISSGGDSDEE